LRLDALITPSDISGSPTQSAYFLRDRRGSPGTIESLGKSLLILGVRVCPVKDETSCTLPRGRIAHPLRGEVPAFFPHFAIAPLLKLFKQSGFDYGKANTDAPLIAHPHDARFCLE
jgi:hypothetical protein